MLLIIPIARGGRTGLLSDGGWDFGFKISARIAGRGCLLAGQARRLVSKKIASAHVQSGQFATVQEGDVGRRRRYDLANNRMRHSESGEKARHLIVLRAVSASSFPRLLETECTPILRPRPMYRSFAAKKMKAQTESHFLDT